MTRDRLSHLRGQLNVLDAFIEEAAQSPHDYDRVLTVRLVCRAISEDIEDNYCREQLDLIELYAGDLFTDGRHQDWERGPVSGADVLRHKMRKCRSMIDARLRTLEETRARPA